MTAPKMRMEDMEAAPNFSKLERFCSVQTGVMIKITVSIVRLLAKLGPLPSSAAFNIPQDTVVVLEC